MICIYTITRQDKTSPYIRPLPTRECMITPTLPVIILSHSLYTHTHTLEPPAHQVLRLMWKYRGYRCCRNTKLLSISISLYQSNYCYCYYYYWPFMLPRGRSSLYVVSVDEREIFRLYEFTFSTPSLTKLLFRQNYKASGGEKPKAIEAIESSFTCVCEA